MISDLQRKKAALEESLTHTTAALEHPEYKDPFVFRSPVQPPKNLFSSQTIRDLLARCEVANIGFDPDLFLQHIEKAALERFNEECHKALEGKSVRELMLMRHETELLMLNDRHEFHTKELAKVNKMLAEQSADMTVEKTVDIEGAVTVTPSENRQNVIGTIGVDKKKKKK